MYNNVNVIILLNNNNFLRNWSETDFKTGGFKTT